MLQHRPGSGTRKIDEYSSFDALSDPSGSPANHAVLATIVCQSSPAVLRIPAGQPPLVCHVPSDKTHEHGHSKCRSPKASSPSSGDACSPIKSPTRAESSSNVPKLPKQKSLAPLAEGMLSVASTRTLRFCMFAVSLLVLSSVLMSSHHAKPAAALDHRTLPGSSSRALHLGASQAYHSAVRQAQGIGQGTVASIRHAPHAPEAQAPQMDRLARMLVTQASIGLPPASQPARAVPSPCLPKSAGDTGAHSATSTESLGIRLLHVLPTNSDDIWAWPSTSSCWTACRLSHSAVGTHPWHGTGNHSIHATQQWHVARATLAAATPPSSTQRQRLQVCVPEG
jgi:hypothetical protein